jgi:hypothetical protein
MKNLMSKISFYAFVCFMMLCCFSACENEESNNPSPDNEIKSRLLNATNIRQSFTDNNENTDSSTIYCAPFSIHGHFIEGNLLHVKVSYGVSCTIKDHEFNLYWSNIYSDSLNVNRDYYAFKLIHTAKLSTTECVETTEYKEVTEYIKIDLSAQPFNLTSEKIKKLTIEIFNGCNGDGTPPITDSTFVFHQDTIDTTVNFTGSETLCKNGDFKIEDVSFYKHFLKIAVAYKGSKPHKFSLVFPEAISAIHPAEIPLYLNHDNLGDTGNSVVHHTFYIDLENEMGLSATFWEDAILTVINSCDTKQVFKEEKYDNPFPQDSSLYYQQDTILQAITDLPPVCNDKSFKIEGAAFYQHFLKLVVSYRGSKAHTISLLYPQVLTDQYPARFTLFLNHDNGGDTGNNLIYHSFYIDLSKNPLGFSAQAIDDAVLSLMNLCNPSEVIKEEEYHDNPQDSTIVHTDSIPQIIGKSNVDFQSDVFKLEGASFAGHFLKFTVSYAGSVLHPFKLVYPEAMIAVYPPMFEIYLTHDDLGDTGKAINTQTFVVDLRGNPLGLKIEDLHKAKITLVNASNIEEKVNNE